MESNLVISSIVFEIWLKILLNLVTRIYNKLKYTLMPFLFKLVCYVFKYICNYTFVMTRLQFCVRNTTQMQASAEKKNCLFIISANKKSSRGY